MEICGLLNLGWNKDTPGPDWDTFDRAYWNGGSPALDVYTKRINDHYAIGVCYFVTREDETIHVTVSELTDTGDYANPDIGEVDPDDAYKLKYINGKELKAIFQWYGYLLSNWEMAGRLVEGLFNEIGGAEV